MRRQMKVWFRVRTNKINVTASDILPGNIGIGPGNGINGTDERPLILEFVIDFNLDSYGGYSNFYIELSFDGDSGDDQAWQCHCQRQDPHVEGGLGVDEERAEVLCVQATSAPRP